MFGFGKKKKVEEKKPEIKVEVHEINVDSIGKSEKEVTDLLFHILTPFRIQIAKKLADSNTEKDDKKFFVEFEKLLESEDDFNPWHIAALMVQYDMVKFFKKKESEKKSKTPTKKSTKSTKKTSTKKVKASK